MKRCPQCNHIEKDDALAYCRADGARLIADADASEPNTAILREGDGSTRTLPQGARTSSNTSSNTGPTSGPTSAELSTGQLPNVPSIAVLPFVHMSADSDNEYFCDGLAEELLNALSKIENLKVAARTSSFSFKGKNVNVDEIGRALHVKTVLEGSVRKSGNRLRITAQLVNAADGYHLWSERYDREMKDVFDIQDEITLAIVDALKLRLLGDTKDEILKRHTEDSAAYQAYLEGRFYWSKRSADGLNRSIECFNRALQIDPGYALAYLGLADAHNILGFYTIRAPKDTFPQAKAAAMKALEIDPSLAEAQASLAYEQFYHEWDWAAAESTIRQAIALKPDYAMAHQYYGNFLTLLARFEEALEEFRRNVQLDPLSLIGNAALGWAFYFARKYDQSIDQLRKVIQLDHNFELAHFWLGSVYADAEMLTEAIQEFETAAGLSANRVGISSSLGYVYALMGDRAKASQILSELAQDSKRNYVSPYRVSNIYTALGDRDEAFAWLERAYDDRSHLLVFMNVDPRVDPLRDDARFVDLVRRVGLPTEAQRFVASGTDDNELSTMRLGQKN